MKLLRISVLLFSILFFSGCFLSRTPTGMSVKDVFGANTTLHFFQNKANLSSQRGVRFIAESTLTTYIYLLNSSVTGGIKVNFDRNILDRFDTTVYVHVTVLNPQGNEVDKLVIEFSPKLLENDKGKTLDLVDIVNGKGAISSKSTRMVSYDPDNIPRINELNLVEGSTIIFQFERQVINNAGAKEQFITPMPSKGLEDFTVSNAEWPSPEDLISKYFKDITLEFFDYSSSRLGFFNDDLGKTPKVRGLLDIVPNLKYSRLKALAVNTLVLQFDFSKANINWGVDFSSINVTVMVLNDSNGIASIYTGYVLGSMKQLQVYLKNEAIANVPPGIMLNKGNRLAILIEATHKPSGQTINVTFNGDVIGNY